MNRAIKEAIKASTFDEVPIGAVIVKDGQIIARGHNIRETSFDSTGHAEIVAIRKANKKLKSWRLSGCTMYVTIEPCAMCAGAISWARITTVVFGSFDPKGGSLGSSFHLYEQKGINHRPIVIHGVMEDECKALMKNYFQSKRQKALSQ
jgi:tRNA(adenine34) deaminase